MFYFKCAISIPLYLAQCINVFITDKDSDYVSTSMLIYIPIIETLSKKLEKQELDYSLLIEESIGNLKSNFEHWIIDIDFKDVSDTDIIRIQKAINDCKPGGKNIIAEIPTPNGAHIITRPFNTQQFMLHQSLYYKCSIQKNNPTILYTNSK